MATAAEVESALRALAKRLSEASVDRGAVPQRTILCVLPDLKTAFHATLADARLKSIKPADVHDETDVRITARSDDLIAMIEGRLNVGMAFMLGRVRIDAPASDLMMIRRLF